MFKPALVIGLGGTGVLTLRHLKAELLGSEGRKMPPQVRLVALDTVKEEGSSGEEISDLAALRTELEVGEYYWIGGDIHDYARDTARDKERKPENRRYPHISSWYQAEQYLAALPRASFTLERGAGQLRQFGRLAVFHDVQTPAMSSIRNLLNTAITEIRDTGLRGGLDVYLVASVAGGTGAGMFVDIAWLVRRIAYVKHNKLPVTLRGFLVLPEAFSAIPGGAKPAMKARAYASMRENKRFMVDFEWRTGYPMFYHAAGSEEGIWHSYIHTKLFDFLYHIDGRREKNPLTSYLPDAGVCPTMADAISAMLDARSELDKEQDKEDPYARHGANVIGTLGQSEDAIGGTAFDSTLGTYTIALPMYHIVEALSYRLAWEALEALVIPEGLDEDGFPTSLAPDRNQEVGEGHRGRGAAIAFLQAAEIQALKGEEKIANTLLLKEVLRIAGQYDPNSPVVVQELAARDVQGWEVHLDPPGDTAEVLAVRQRVQRELASRLIDDVPPAGRGEKPADALPRIRAGVEQYKAYHLGREDVRTGQRVGGQYRQALDDYGVVHRGRFKLMLGLESQNVLNGGVGRNQYEQKAGKLGYLLDFLGGLEEILSTFLRVLNEARLLRESQQRKQAVLSAVQAAKREMEAAQGIFARPVAKQRNYLNREQELIDLIKVEIMEQAVRATAGVMLEHVQELKGNAEAWARTLGIGYDGLYARLLRGRRQIEDMLTREDTAIPVRKIIWDPDYQERLYQKYAQELRQGLEEMLASLTWRHRHLRVGTREESRYELVVDVPEGEKEENLLGLTDQDRNLEIILAPCRRIFADAWKQESVLKYLMEKHPRAEQLADEMAAKCEPLLAFREAGRAVPTNYLHIAYGREATETSYLKQVRERLADRTQAKGKLNDTINSADRFRCRLVYTLDLIPLEQVDSYRGGIGSYRTFTEVREGMEGMRGRLGRETLHIFPAEVNAAHYESQLSSLRQPPREFHNDVVLQLEDIERFRLFVRSWAYGVVRKDQIERDQGLLNYYCLDFPEERGVGFFGVEPATKLYLTTPVLGQSPDVLEALKTFNYEQQDVRPDYYARIDYDRARRALGEAKKLKVDELLAAPAEGEPPRLKLEEAKEQRLNDLPPGDREKVLRLLAEHQLLQEAQKGLFPDLSEGTPQKMRDVSTVFYLALAEDIRSFEEAVDHRLGASRGLA